jgi:DNA helicase-2/ATP-dependent DNA helicase PcrA
VIVKNKFRVPKNLFSQKESGPKIILFEASNEDEEASFIAEMTGRLKADGEELQNIAVLYRTNFQSRVIEEKMLGANIPYQVIGVKFYERREIKDALAYLKAALSPDDLLSLKRIINTPPRGIGKTLALKFLARDSLTQKETEKISGFKKTIEKIKTAIGEKKTSEAIKFVILKSGLKEYLNDGTEDGAMRLANIEELVTLARRHDDKKPPDGILNLLEEVALMSMVHAAKGLEFKAIFVAGLEEGLFPHHAILGEELEMREEEERRLFYVALTRAKKRIFLSYAVFRTIFGERKINRPSSFLFDIPDELLEKAPEKIIELES